jgi:hypothetical protein
MFGPTSKPLCTYAYIVALAGDIDVLPEPQPKPIFLL